MSARAEINERSKLGFNRTKQLGDGISPLPRGRLRQPENVEAAVLEARGNPSGKFVVLRPAVLRACGVSVLNARSVRLAKQDTAGAPPYSPGFADALSWTANEPPVANGSGRAANQRHWTHWALAGATGLCHRTANHRRARCAVGVPRISHFYRTR